MEVIDFGVEAGGLSASMCCHRLRLLFSVRVPWLTRLENARAGYLVLNGLRMVMRQAGQGGYRPAARVLSIGDNALVPAHDLTSGRLAA